ncbi:MAG TPA: AMP-binding protein [Xanthobacteraceae bacterium]|nr:AMP-binding protein [Xanthobacteraceae bacterium]
MLTESLAVGATDQPLIEKTIGDVFDDTVARWPDRGAIVSRHEGLRYTYRDLQREVNRLASALLELGLVPGDRVGVWSHNNVAWLLTQLATAKTGLILVTINPAYRVTELEYALNKSGCKMLVTMRQFKTSNYLDILLELAPELRDGIGGELHAAKLPHLRHVMWTDGVGQELDERQAWVDQSRAVRFSRLLASGNEDDPRVQELARTLRATDPINIQFTSGTTGFPKGATLTHRNILNNGFFVGEQMKLTHEDKLCVPVPLYHCFGMVMGNLACISHGSTIVYPNDGFDPLTVLQAIEEEGCTALHGVPTMFAAELDHPRFKEYDLSTLRTGIMAGAPCPIELMKRAVNEMHLSEITIAYGMTETSPVSCQSTTDAPLDKRVSSVGTVHPHIEIKIIDPATGSVLPAGETGELCTRGYSVMRGYWGDEAKTQEVLDRDGWMHTGDLGVINPDGYVNIVGRIKDLIIRGGENISPFEIEEFLCRHPMISSAQVVGVPDEKYGEALCAWLILKPGSALSADEVRDFCKGQIAHYKVPKYIRIVTEFPMTVTGKIQKFKIREDMQKVLGLTEQATA